MLSLHIDEEFSGWIEALGLRTFADFMAAPVGELLDAGRNGRELRRIRAVFKGQWRTFYLKRIGREPFFKLAQPLLFGRLPRSGPLREQRMLLHLNESGFATMRPAAFGEKRLLGWPAGGFLLVEEVAGKELADLYQSSKTDMRQKLAEALGAYLGRLHCAGFFQPVRLKDLFISPKGGTAADPFVFVLIDRETSKPWPGRFSRFGCLQTLARATRRTLRDGYVIGRGEMRSFCRGYQRTAGENLGLSTTALRGALFAAYRRELKRSSR